MPTGTQGWAQCATTSVMLSRSGAHHRPKAHAATQSTPTTNAEAAASQAPASVARLVVTYKCGCQHALVLPTESRSERHALPGDHVFAIVR